MRVNAVVLRLVVFLVSVMSLGGCYQKVDQHDINKGAGFCGGVDNILYIRADFAGVEAVRCTNGEMETWN